MPISGANGMDIFIVVRTKIVINIDLNQFSVYGAISHRYAQRKYLNSLKV